MILAKPDICAISSMITMIIAADAVRLYIKQPG
jgi:hypothetical protein